jgi:CheY-like chemotaxis protein
MMNGQIRVSSKKGEGTTFFVTVTLTDSDKKRSTEGDIEINLAGQKVLVVDDDPLARDQAKLILSKIGVEADMADSGAGAVEAVKVCHARQEPYTLIIIDWKMPDMDGVETARQIRSIIGEDTAIIILTAYNWDEILDEALAAGVDSFIAKPLFSSNLIEELKDVMRRRRLSAAPAAEKTDITGCHILLAEDMEINAEILMEILRTRSIETDHAEDGTDAVELFRSHPEGYYDAILMDMRMAEMDGLTATQKIRAMDRKDAASIPIIALTANAFDEDVQRSLQAGLNAHLSKPVEPDLLFETLEKLIKRG